MRMPPGATQRKRAIRRPRRPGGEGPLKEFRHCKLRWDRGKCGHVGNGGLIRAPGRESEVDDESARRPGGRECGGEISPLGPARWGELISGPAG